MCQIFCRRLHFERQRKRGNHIGGTMSYDMCTQQRIVLRIGHNFNKAVRVQCGDTLSVRRQWKLSHLYLMPRILRFLFGVTHCSDFRFRENASRHRAPVHGHFVPGRGFGGQYSFVRCFVSKQLLSGHIAYGKDPRNAGGHGLINFNESL